MALKSGAKVTKIEAEKMILVRLAKNKIINKVKRIRNKVIGFSCVPNKKAPEKREGKLLHL